MQLVRDYCQEHLSEIVDELSELCAIPSLFDRPAELQAAADWIAEALEGCGLAVQLVPSPDGPPTVLAEKLVRGKPTLLFYNHYDVQPAGDESLWRFPPFAPQLYRRRLYGRGTVDDKGALLVRLWALRAWRKLYGRLPVGVRFLVEGEEETGSPHLANVVEQHADSLRADGCVWESGEFSNRGQPEIYLGMKGLVSVELEAHGAAGEVHSGWATIAPNPLWRLLWALACLKSSAEEVLIDGFYDDVEGPSRAEIDRARSTPFAEKEFLEAWQIPHFLQYLSDGSLLLCHFFSPTCNVSGIEGGYVGPGERTIIPNSARARVDFRLVPQQQPDKVLQLLRQHLDREGFSDVTVRTLGPSLAPFRTPPDAPFVRAVVEATHAAFGKRPAVFASTGGSGPIALVGERLQAPIVGMGVGYPEANVHGANENVRTADLERGVLHVAAVLERLAKGLSK